MGKFLIRYWLTIVMLIVCLGLAVWAWLAFRDVLTGFQSLGLTGRMITYQAVL
jgi:hypothetical protein